MGFTETPFDTLCRSGLEVPALSQQERQPQIGDRSAINAKLSIIFVYSKIHNPFERNVEEAG